MRQKIIFASQESESEINYDISLVQNMFLHALMTGFSDDNIKSDMKTFLSDKTVSDETLFEQLNKATNSVNERKKKLQSASRTARVNEITSSDVSQNNNKTEKPKKENPIVNEIREMKSGIVAAIRGSVVNKSSSSISEVKAYQKPNQLKPKGVRVGGLCENLVVSLVEVKEKVVNVITASGVEVQNTTKQDAKTVW